MSFHPTLTAYRPPRPYTPSEHQKRYGAQQYATSSNTESDNERLTLEPGYVYHHETRKPYHLENNRGSYQNGHHFTDESRSGRKMREVMDQLETMKDDFQKDKYSIYMAKKKALNQELQDIYDGTSTEFQDIMSEFAAEQEREDVRIKAFYKYKYETARAVHAAVREEIEEEYKQILEENKTRLLAEIAKKRKLVEEESSDASDGSDVSEGEIPSHDPQDSGNKGSSSDPSGANNRKKIRSNRQTTLPGASYKEVLEDFHEIFGDNPPPCLSNARFRRRTNR